MIYFWLGMSIAFNVAQFIIFLLCAAGAKANREKRDGQS